MPFLQRPLYLSLNHGTVHQCCGAGRFLCGSWYGRGTTFPNISDPTSNLQNYSSFFEFNIQVLLRHYCKIHPMQGIWRKHVQAFSLLNVNFDIKRRRCCIYPELEPCKISVPALEKGYGATISDTFFLHHIESR
jgi:hypothetical protein